MRTLKKIVIFCLLVWAGFAIADFTMGLAKKAAVANYQNKAIMCTMEIDLPECDEFATGAGEPESE